MFPGCTTPTTNHLNLGLTLWTERSGSQLVWFEAVRVWSRYRVHWPGTLSTDQLQGPLTRYRSTDQVQVHWPGTGSTDQLQGPLTRYMVHWPVTGSTGQVQGPLIRYMVHWPGTGPLTRYRVHLLPPHSPQLSLEFSSKIKCASPCAAWSNLILT